MSDTAAANHEHSIILYDEETPEVRDGTEHYFARGQNFVIEWVEAKAPGATFEATTAEEAFVLLPATGATIEGEGESAEAPRRSVCILSPGTYRITLDEAAPCACFYSDPTKFDLPAMINSGAYSPSNPLVAPVGKPFKRVDGSKSITVIEIDKITTQGKNSAMKVLQCATMSINWVDRDKPRDRTDLTPHVHGDFEQGSLAVFGNFVHHLRTEWGKNAELWRDDVHTQVPPKSLLVIPPTLIHTTEAINEEAHLLIDVFAPARRDFIAKGFVANADDYVEP